MEATIQKPDMQDACEVFHQWAATAEGKRSWLTSCTQLSLQGIWNGLVHAQATRLGLPQTHRGAIIWSRFSQEAHTRLAPLSDEAAQTGLCFWYDSVPFIRVGKESFIECIKTLPVPRAGLGIAPSLTSPLQWPNGRAHEG